MFSFRESDSVERVFLLMAACGTMALLAAIIYWLQFL
ncbi:hypothetical protein BN961_01398 [Afipia felis]|uniref:Uncharacterized protein n=1 Tax=Afipia felis TaxID=1035 RepID=A0A090MKP3_AFIFE|nr:hypothetical protein AfiDRAFT_2281 [Afipia sp. 1NLS2]CEG07991.1 hypothetical protein BN961_01398 [Afipia felis]